MGLELGLDLKLPSGEDPRVPTLVLTQPPPVYLGTGPGRGFVPSYCEERGINYFLSTFCSPFPQPGAPLTLSIPQPHPGLLRAGAELCPCQQRCCFSSHPSPSAGKQKPDLLYPREQRLGHPGLSTNHSVQRVLPEPGLGTIPGFAVAAGARWELRIHL